MVILANNVLEIIGHLININDNIFSHFIGEKNYLWHNDLVQQHF